MATVAAAARCPKSCISMEPDDCGFLHPTVDASGCVGCGACDAVCPALNAPGEDGCEFALWAKAHDVGLLDRSSSGGVFGLLAGDALSRGGVVAGAAWTDGCRELRHVLVEDRPALGAVMRSKYVQSAVGRGVFEGVRAALREGRPALFAGTACQVAGMRSYLGKLADSDLFLGVDVICHGVPSPELWSRWVDYRGEAFGSDGSGGGDRRARGARWRGRAGWWRRSCRWAARCRVRDGSRPEARDCDAQDDHDNQNDSKQDHGVHAIQGQGCRRRYG